jgi:nicotinamidase-related amidase
MRNSAVFGVRAVFLLCMVASGEFFVARAVRARPSADTQLRVSVKERKEEQSQPGKWRSVEQTEQIAPKKTAIVICDMWDNHWCHGAVKRVQTLALRMVPVLDAARRHGVLIIHAPSDTIDFYKDAPERKAAEAAPAISPPESHSIPEGPLPIDFADGGCDTSPPDKYYKAWTRENSLIPIASNDLISTDGSEVYRNLKSRGIETVMYVGVHANICILKRSFALRQMRAWGVHCLLIRDLTDAMYNPHDAPYVSHEQGTELVIRHIERYLAPSIVSADLLNALGR